MKNILVLGAGLVGKTIAIDLCKNYNVTSADVNETALAQLRNQHPIKTVVADLSISKNVHDLVQPFDLIIGAVPGFMGFKTLKTIIEAGKNVVDISFFPEDPFDLDLLATKHNVTAIVDCGVAPGMCNVLAGYHNTKMKLESYECMVGGLPMVREWPFEYKAVFSPIDVIEEYTRPARYIEDGKLVVREALSDAEYINFENIGTLESFNTDGLRTLAFTLPRVPNMKEKTLRYPGHIALMRVFRETGFFNKEKIPVNGVEVSPLEFTSKLLFPKWKLQDGEEDFTIMQVVLKGKDSSGKSLKHVYTLHDKFDSTNQATSMARTTGFTCTAAAQLFLQNKFSQKGICPPEYLGQNEKCFESMLKYLEERNVKYSCVTTAGD